MLYETLLFTISAILCNLLLQLLAIYKSIGLHLKDHLLYNLEEEYYMILDIFITRDAPY